MYMNKTLDNFNFLVQLFACEGKNVGKVNLESLDLPVLTQNVTRRHFSTRLCVFNLAYWVTSKETYVRKNCGIKRGL